MTAGVFQRPDLLRFVAARVTNGAAFQMTSVALGWLVYARTGSAVSLGLVGLCQFLPTLPLFTLTGHAADHHDRRWVIVASFVAQAAGSLALFGFSRAQGMGMGWLYAILLVMGAARAFSPPAQQALLATLVPREELSRAVAFSSSTGQLAVIVGPAIGGLAYALVGPVTFLVVAALHLAAAAVLLPLKSSRPEPSADRSGLWTRAFAGLAYLRSNRLLLGAISLDLFAVLFGAVTSLLPIFAHDILKVGPIGLGVLQSGPAVGAVVVGALLTRLQLRRRAGATMLWSVAGYGLATILFALSTNFVLSMLAMVAIGGFDMVSVVVRQTLVQVATPDAMRGRVGAVSTMFVSGSNRLGDFESGMLASLVGAAPAAVIGGVGTILVVGAVAWLTPELRKADRLDG